MGESDERRVEPGHRGSGILQWLLVLAPPGIAFEQQQIAYAFVGWGCKYDSTLAVHLPAAIALTLVLALAVPAAMTWNRVGWRAPGEERTSDARARFMASLALLTVAFSAVWIVAQWLPIAFIDPCQR